MIIKHSREAAKEIPAMKGVQGVTLQWLITKKDGAPHYAMRLFTIEPNGEIPLHAHDDMEHEMFILDGTAVLRTGRGEQPVAAGDAVLVGIGDEHGFVNRSDKPFRFICVIPA